jgi:hypothetical protein
LLQCEHEIATNARGIARFATRTDRPLHRILRLSLAAARSWVGITTGIQLRGPERSEGLVSCNIQVMPRSSGDVVFRRHVELKLTISTKELGFGVSGKLGYFPALNLRRYPLDLAPA